MYYNQTIMSIATGTCRRTPRSDLDISSAITRVDVSYLTVQSNCGQESPKKVFCAITSGLDCCCVEDDDTDRHIFAGSYNHGPIASGDNPFLRDWHGINTLMPEHCTTTLKHAEYSATEGEGVVVKGRLRGMKFRMA